MNIERDEHIKIRDASFSLLAEGKTLKVRAEGYSMFPSIKPGAVILIEPIPEGSFPSPGEIVAWKRESGFVVHRLIRILRDGEKAIFITRGDSCAYEDKPVNPDQVAGRVIKVESVNGREISSGDNLIRKPSYLYNRLMVWGLIIYKRIKDIILRKMF